jgi:hypothetical protein
MVSLIRRSNACCENIVGKSLILQILKITIAINPGTRQARLNACQTMSSQQVLDHVDKEAIGYSHDTFHPVLRDIIVPQLQY